MSVDTSDVTGKTYKLLETSTNVFLNLIFNYCPGVQPLTPDPLMVKILKKPGAQVIVEDLATLFEANTCGFELSFEIQTTEAFFSVSGSKLIGTDVPHGLFPVTVVLKDSLAEIHSQKVVKVNSCGDETINIVP